jgi:ABC-2 type transport system ATP-binding protein
MKSTDIPVTLDATGATVRTTVRTTGIAKRYGDTHALRGVEITVPTGAFYVLVGPNGAGKSTFIRILLDLVRADSGTAHVFGLDVRSGPGIRAQTGWVPERAEAVYGWMRAGQFIDAHAAYFPTWDRGYAARLASEFSIDLTRKLNRMSKGEVRRVQILAALAHRPKLLLLDEPTEGLDPVARSQVLGILAEHLADTGATVVASTHAIHEIDRFADHVCVLSNGRVTAQMHLDLLASNMRSYRVQTPAAEEPSATGSPAPIGEKLRIISVSGSQRDLSCTIWGDEAEVRAELAGAGATLRDVTPLTLEEAVVALMSRPQGDRG